MTAPFPDFRPSGNAAANPGLYDVENRAIDPDGLVLDAMRKLAAWAGRVLVDLGCGTGYWLDGCTGEAGEVIGVEPDPTLVELARRPMTEVLTLSKKHTWLAKFT